MTSTPLHITLLALCLATLSGAATYAQGPRWSQSELSAINRGDLATRSVEQSRSGLELMGGSSWRIVNASPTQAWSAIRDVDRYRHMLPLIHSVTRISGDDQAMRVRIHQGQGPIDVRYHLDLRFDDATRTMRFRLDDSRVNDIRAAWGYVRIEPWEDGRTLFAWGVMADFGDDLLTGIVRPVVRRWMLRVPTTFRDYLEGWGSRNYASR